MKTKSPKSPNASDPVPPTDNAERKPDNVELKSEAPSNLLIAAIGASAGGLEAGIDLVRHLDPDTGMAYVFIQHLDPAHHSIIRDLLAKETAIPVTEVTDGAKVVPNHIYVIPPNAMLTIADHNLRLGPRDPTRAGHMPIDHFMRTLADQLGSRAIGVILSGTGSDGVLGMAEIQARGGVTFAQDPETAKFNGMPNSAVAAGCVDYVLPPGTIAGELARLAQHPYVSPPPRSEVFPAIEADGSGLNTVFQLLRRALHVDFSYYRKSTILRRIQRRMVVHKIDRFSDYVRFLQSNTAEIKALYQDMLIHVTSFFRNPNVFESLKRSAFPQILEKKGPDSNIRIWVPGCASGEETYSLAISLLEFLSVKSPDISIQLFGTDISEASIKRARAGIYPANIQGDVSPERIRRFFQKGDGGYRINKAIREMCIFAQHNLLNDPPFSRMDLICCRNLLIYFEPVLQGRVVSLFHYALRPGGFLVLGTSEGIRTSGHLFNLEDRENKIFSRKASSGRQTVTFSLNRQSEQIMDEGALAGPPLRADISWSYLESQRDFDRRLLAHYVPATVFVNRDLEIVHTRGKFNRYFTLPTGRPTLNLLKMAHDELMLSLQGALLAAKKTGRPVRRSDVALRISNGSKGGRREEIVSFEVTPLKYGTNELCYMIVFFEGTPPWSHGKGAKSSGSRGRERRNSSSQEIKRLEQELATAKEHLESVVENQELTNEELQSSNEETLSSNEELQSTNEELETAKEELQSTNEELSTVNDELRNRNLQLSEAQKQLREVLTAINIAVVGNDLEIKEFTPASRKLLSLLPNDVAAAILERSAHASDLPDFRRLVKQAIGSATQGEQVIECDGRPYRVRVVPFKGTSDRADGYLVTLIDTSLAEQLSGKSRGLRADEGEGEKGE